MPSFFTGVARRIGLLFTKTGGSNFRGNIQSSLWEILNKS